jgi:putative NADH-flavin reductase
MKLLLLGATGKTGRQVLAQALEGRHDVTALVRSPEKLMKDPHLEVRVGSVMDPAAVEDAVRDRGAVISTLGTRRARDLFGADIMTKTMHAVVPAMERHGVSRLIVLSAVGVGEVTQHAPAMIRIAFRTLLRQIAKDKAASEEYVRAGGLDWTFVYPPMLTNGALTQSYRAGEDLRLHGRARISRADVAHFMLAQLEDGAYSRKNAIISA